jgi:hypothetical protein
LHTCLVFYAQALKKVGSSDVQLGSHDLKEVAMSEYQPNTLEKIHKQLFAEFQKNSIYLQQRDFKQYGAGSYKAYWKTRMAATKCGKEARQRLWRTITSFACSSSDDMPCPERCWSFRPTYI